MSIRADDKMSSVTIELNGPPKGKGRARFVRKTGIAYTPEKTRNYEAVLRFAAVVAMRGKLPMEGPVAVLMTAYFPIPTSWGAKKRLAALERAILPTTKPDIDNIVKVLDALNGVVFNDDKQVVSCSVSKLYCSRPRLRIIVSRYGVERDGNSEPRPQLYVDNGTR